MNTIERWIEKTRETVLKKVFEEEFGCLEEEEIEIGYEDWFDSIKMFIKKEVMLSDVQIVGGKKIEKVVFKVIESVVESENDWEFCEIPFGYAWLKIRDGCAVHVRLLEKLEGEELLELLSL
jgi:hypothetical protein